MTPPPDPLPSARPARRRPRLPPLAAALLAAALLAACASGPPPRSAFPRAGTPGGTPPITGAAQAAVQRATDQVVAAERGFAQTMADRNFKAFLSYLSPDAVFFNGSSIEHGPAEIAAQWEPYFNGRAAPFAWHPDHVEVLPDGKLALSTGPLIADGQVVGRFDSIWRLEAPGSWHIVFDKGEPVCAAPGSGTAGTAATGPQIIVTQ